MAGGMAIILFSADFPMIQPALLYLAINSTGAFTRHEKLAGYLMDTIYNGKKRTD